MKCPHCGQEIAFAEVCPKCGSKISYGGNTVLYKATASGKLSYKEIFSNVLKKHTPQDALRSLSAGPSQGVDMLKNWQRPWMFLWVFVFLVIIAALLHTSLSDRYTANETYTFAVFTSLIVPITLAVLVWEMDIYRNINILDFLVLVLLGGLASIIIAGPINDRVLIELGHLGNSPTRAQIDEAISKYAWTAGITEEPTKLLVAVGFILATQNRKRFYGLDGLALGVAVAAGFAFWENFDYAMNKGGGTSLGIATMAIERTTWGIFGSHMLYTAPFVGALCLAMNGRKLNGKHFLSPTFLFTLVFGMGCHALNNFGLQFQWFQIGPVPISFLQVLLGIFTWSMLLYMLRKGVNQALETNDINQAVYQAHTQAHSQAALVCRTGTYAGSAFAVAGQPIVLGRDSKECNLVLKGNSVSRKHGMLRYENGRVVYRDLGSSNGSYVNGKKIAPNADTALKPGDALDIGSGAERFEVA